MLPLPICYLIPLVIPDALLDLALLDCFTSVFLEGTSNRHLTNLTRTRICILNLPHLLFSLSRELFIRK
jgi:hypothetical protein